MLIAKPLTNAVGPLLVALTLNVGWLAHPVAAQSSDGSVSAAKVVRTAVPMCYRPGGCVPGPDASPYAWRVLSIEWRYWRGEITPAQRRREHLEALKDTLLPPGWRLMYEACRAGKKWFFGRE